MNIRSPRPKRASWVERDATGRPRLLKTVFTDISDSPPFARMTITSLLAAVNGAAIAGASRIIAPALGRLL